VERTLILDCNDKVGETVTISGWVQVRRDHGKIGFLDVMDRTGTIQVFCTGDKLGDIRSQDVVEITGKVAERPEKLINPNPTKIEKASPQNFTDFSGQWQKDSCTGDMRFDGPITIKNNKTQFVINNIIHLIDQPLQTTTYTNPKIGEIAVTHSLATWNNDGSQLILKQSLVSQLGAGFQHIESTLSNMIFSLNNGQLEMVIKSKSFHDLDPAKVLSYDITCRFNRVG